MCNAIQASAEVATELSVLNLIRENAFSFANRLGVSKNYIRLSVNLADNWFESALSRICRALWFGTQVSARSQKSYLRPKMQEVDHHLIHATLEDAHRISVMTTMKALEGRMKRGLTCEEDSGVVPWCFSKKHRDTLDKMSLQVLWASEAPVLKLLYPAGLKSFPKLQNLFGMRKDQAFA